ncbi:MAG: flagellar hook-length control protein FliK [Bacillota bacterium]|nr:flagellar hook-length control protein FliK [Bacillota bacterium]
MRESLTPGVAADPGLPAGADVRVRPAGTVIVDPGSGGAVTAKPVAASESGASAHPPSGSLDGAPAAVTAQAPPPAGTFNSPPGLSPAQVVQQVMRHLDQMRDHPGQPVRVEIAVDPPHLGPVTVKLTLVRGELSAQFFTPDGAVRDAIQAVLPQLREQLAQHQLQLGQAGVFLGHGDASPGRGQGQWWQAPEAAWAVPPETWSAPDPGTPGREPASPERLNYLV